MPVLQRIKVPVFFLSLLLLSDSVAQSLTVEEEVRYGRQLYLQLVRDCKLVKDPILLVYVDSIKKRLQREASVPFDLKVTLVESRKLDAFATIGGYVFVTTELVVACENEDELAGVLAHEMSHVAKRHVSKRLERERKVSMALLAATFASMLASSEKAKEALITGTAASYEALRLWYSREDEEEADLYGSYILERAGYDASGLREFLKRLRTKEEKEVPQYLLTHPYVEERIKRLERRQEGERPREKDLFPFLRARLEAALPGEQESNEVASARKPAGLYRQALLLEKKGRIDEALKVLETVDLPAFLLAELLVKAGRLREAETLMEQGDSPFYTYLRGLSLEAQGKKEEAFSLLTRILDVGWTCHEIFRRYGILAGRLGREAEGYEYLGLFELLEGRRIQAKRYIEKAISIYGANTEKGRALSRILDDL